MRCLNRNKQRFFYALYEGKEPLTDDNGYVTGEDSVIYGKPRVCYGNISAAVGEATVRQFGGSVDYDKVIVMGVDAPDIDEFSVLWVDTIPEIDEDGNLLLNEKEEVKTPHDYLVRKVAKSLNSVSYAIRKVKVS